MNTLSRILLAGAVSLTAACGTDDGACDPDAPGTICTVIGSGLRGFNVAEGHARTVDLSVPQDVAIAPNGEIWVLDFNNYLVRAVDTQWNLTTVIGTGQVGDDPDPGEPPMPALQASFNHTTNLFFDGGSIYLAAWHSSRIKKIALDTMLIENYAGRGRRTFYDGDGGPALDASLDLPSSIAKSPQGDIVIMDQASQVIRKISAADGTIDTIVGTCVVDYDTPCDAGEQPVACPGSGKLTCGDPALECVKECSTGYAGDGGPARAARLAQPAGQDAPPAGRIAYDSRGNLIFADTGNNRIRKVDTNGIITTIAGTGVAGAAGDGVPAIEAQLHEPVDIAIAPDDTIYFADAANSCIRKIDAAGMISTVVGLCSEDPADRGYSGDGGPPRDARLNRAYGVHLEGSKLYVSDSYNDVVRVVNLP